MPWSQWWRNDYETTRGGCGRGGAGGLRRARADDRHYVSVDLHDRSKRRLGIALAQHVDTQRADQVAAQRSGAPELLVVAALGVEADHERRPAEPVAKRVDVVGEVRAAAFLARLDQHHAAGVRHALLAQGANGGQRGKEGIAIVRAAAAVELAVAQHGGPRVEAVRPAGELGLLVEVAIEQHAIVALSRHLDEDQRRAPGGSAKVRL